MKDFIKELLQRIEDKGFKAYVVGGYVRDFLLEIESKDIDITTNALPEDLKGIFGDDLTIYKSYGACHLKNDEYKIDFNTFRRELEYFNNKPVKIEYINDLYTDLLRRDFTINSLCLDKDSNLIDLLSAKNDLDNSIIKVIGDINKKFNEDATRIIKAIRFMCTLNFQLDNEIIEYIINNKSFIKRINLNKQKEELDKILSSNPKLFISFLKEYNLDNIFGIDVNSFVISDSIEEMYAQMNLDDKFPFTRKEKKKIKLFNKKTLI